MPFIITGYDQYYDPIGYFEDDTYNEYEPPPDPYAGGANQDTIDQTIDVTKSPFWNEIKTLPPATQASLAQLTTDGINKLVGLFKKQATNLDGTPKKNADGTPDMSGVDWDKIAGLGGAAIGLFADKTPITAGSTLPIPNYDVARSSVQYNDTNRLPGEVGRDYFSETRYTPRTGVAATDTAARAADLAAVKTEATGIASGYKPTGPEVNPYASGEKAFKTKYNPTPAVGTGAGTTTATNASGVASVLPISARMPVSSTTKTDIGSGGQTTASSAPYMPTMGGPYTESQEEKDAYATGVRNKTAANTGAVSGQSSVPSDPQQAAAQDAVNQREKSGNKNTGLLTDPSHIGGVGYTLNPNYDSTGTKMTMDYQPKYITDNKNTYDINKYLSEYTPLTTAAQGGLMSFAKGGANYLRGRTDGMADKLNTSIDNTQAAKLSHGEFVIPADVVSHLGNGNSDAGADKLYQMMARIRKARTGNPEQGKRINPDKFMPGGLATLNMGGAIGFNGATAGSAVTGTGATDTSTAPKLGTSTSSSLSPWAAPYVTSLLGKTAAEANSPYTAYKGPLVAGTSDLQQQAFAGAKTVADAGYDPTKFTGDTFDATQAQKYMNPYLSAVLDPQMKELQRQADITRVGDAGRMTQAGAFGGSRQAIAESEGRKNLLNTQAATLGQGYASAYDKAMGQFNTQADRDMGAQKASEESRQFSANFGLKSLADLERMGATQRQIKGEGIAADKAQFEEQRNYPKEQLKFQRDMITGLPISTAATTANTSQSTNASNDLRTLTELLKTLGIVPK